MCKKLYSVLCVLLVLALFAGCAPAEPIQNDAVSTNTSETDDSTETSAPEGEADDEEKELITLTYYRWMPPEAAQTITSYDECYTYIELQEMMNIDIEFIHPPVGQEAEQMNLMISSRELPDIIQGFGYNKGLDAAIEDGLILRLNELIDQYAPNYKKLRTFNEEVARQTITDEGNIAAMYCLQIDESGDTAPAWLGLSIRQDFLDKLGLEKPTTIDEWENVLRRFKNELGVKAPLDFNVNGWQFDTTGIFVSAWDIGPNWYQDEVDGKMVVKYGPYEEAYGEFLGRMAQWYKEGLLNPDCFTRDASTFDAMIYNGEIAAACNSGYGPTLSYNLYAKQNGNEEFSFVPVQSPSLEKGQVVRYRNVEQYNKGEATVITTACKYPERAVELLDYGYSEEGYMLFNYGVEGISYEMVDGKPQWTEAVTNDPQGRNWPNIRDLYKVHLGPYWRDWAAFPVTDFELECMEIWTIPKPELNLPILTRTAEENVRFGELWADINTYVNEMRIKFVTGEEPIENYDEFRNQLKAMGIEELIAINQAALDRYYSR